jgi:hypothetical protein
VADGELQGGALRLPNRAQAGLPSKRPPKSSDQRLRMRRKNAPDVVFIQ